MHTIAGKGCCTPGWPMGAPKPPGAVVPGAIAGCDQALPAPVSFLSPGDDVHWCSDLKVDGCQNNI